MRAAALVCIGWVALRTVVEGLGSGWAVALTMAMCVMWLTSERRAG